MATETGTPSLFLAATAGGPLLEQPDKSEATTNSQAPASRLKQGLFVLADDIVRVTQRRMVVNIPGRITLLLRDAPRPILRSPDLLGNY
jgi:hypothetical protein